MVVAARLLAPAQARPGAAGLRQGRGGRREGYLRVPADGGYTFMMTAPDGSYLQIGDTVLFDDSVANNIAYGVAGGAAIAAAVLWLTGGPESRVAVAPHLGAVAGLDLAVRF